MPTKCVVVYGMFYKLNKITGRDEIKNATTFFVCFDEYAAKRKIEKLKIKYTKKYDTNHIHPEPIEWWEFYSEECEIEFE